MDDILFKVSVWVIPLLTAITLHEAAHGYVALRYGDDTALRAGRITMNPLKHVDPFGTVILPALLLISPAPFLFGYAKPVPVNFSRLDNPKRDMIWVAAAGPAINVAMAYAAALLWHLLEFLPESAGPWVAANLANAFMLNIMLAIFNMLPLPPLDGGRVMTGLLPMRLARPYARIERYGMLILLGLIMIPPLVSMQLGINFSILGAVILPPYEFTANLLQRAAGLL